MVWVFSEHSFIELHVYREQTGGGLLNNYYSPNLTRFPKCNTAWEQLQSYLTQTLLVLTPYFLYRICTRETNKQTNKSPILELS